MKSVVTKLEQINKTRNDDCVLVKAKDNAPFSDGTIIYFSKDVFI